MALNKDVSRSKDKLEQRSINLEELSSVALLMGRRNKHVEKERSRLCHDMGN